MLAAEYVCVPGVHILVPGTIFVSLIETVDTVVKGNAIWFNSTLSLGVKLPTYGWNLATHKFGSGATSPQYEVTIGPKQTSFTVNGRAVFDECDLITTVNFNIGNEIGILSLLQQLQPADPLYPATAFCLYMKDACSAWGATAGNAQHFGYGDPTKSTNEFLSSCLTALVGAKLASTGSPLFGANSFGCRAFHLGMAFSDPDMHCPHCALNSTVCTSSQQLYN